MINVLFLGHVIPGEQLFPAAVSSGPTGVQLDFTYQNRNKPKVVSMNTQAFYCLI